MARPAPLGFQRAPAWAPARNGAALTHSAPVASNAVSRQDSPGQGGPSYLDTVAVFAGTSKGLLAALAAFTGNAIIVILWDSPLSTLASMVIPTALFGAIFAAPLRVVRRRRRGRTID